MEADDSQIASSEFALRARRIWRRGSGSNTPSCWWPYAIEIMLHPSSCRLRRTQLTTW